MTTEPARLQTWRATVIVTAEEGRFGDGDFFYRAIQALLTDEGGFRGDDVQVRVMDVALIADSEEGPTMTHWTALQAWLEEDCGIDASGAETLIRLAASTADENRMGDGHPYVAALRSFGEPDEVDALALGVADRLYNKEDR